MSGEGSFEAGKLPPDLLAALLARYITPGPDVIVPPAVGVDAAVLDPGPGLLVAKSDPITFATDQIGRYAVHVNANDIACMGATPRYFLATLLLPPGATTPLIERIFAQIAESCDALDVRWVGGHTEVTYGLERPIVAGTMLGTVAPGRLLTPAQAAAGDVVLLARGFPIEGAAIIAYERADDLLAMGWPRKEIEAGQALLTTPGISVLAAARHAAAHGARAMHDPTEGGVLTGLHEIAAATGLGIEAEAGALRPLPLAARLCAAFGLDPLGTIASGSLLIVVPPDRAAEMVAGLREEGINAGPVAVLHPAAHGRWLAQDGARVPLPTFDVDEITRLF